jgi:hypothetical protein
MSNLRPMLMLILSFLLVSPGVSQSPQWKGTIEFEDGVKIIKNPREPLYGDFVFDLDEKLSIGNETDDNYMFYRVRNITADALGNVYVSDFGNYRIQVFDPNGKYLFTVGGHGEGPGEFQWTLNLRIEEKSRDLYVIDGLRSLERFDHNGQHKDTVNLGKNVSDFYPDSSGNLLAIVDTVSESELSKTLCRMDAKGEILENYVKFPWNIFYEKKGEVSTMSVHSDTPTLMMAKIDGQRFVYGYSDEYELNVIDNSGKLLFKIQKDETPKEFSAAEKRKARRFQLPEHKPFFYRIFTDPEGRIYVQTNLTRGEPTDFRAEVDIFSRDGYFLHRSTLPRVVYAIGDGMVYRYYWDDESGEELVKCYKVTNWDKMKTGLAIE